jgi:hypothetical protein
MKRPPSDFHRWIAAHPIQWVAVTVGVLLVVLLGGSMSDALWWGISLVALALFGAAAYIGAMLTRRMVERYDAAK